MKPSYSGVPFRPKNHCNGKRSLPPHLGEPDRSRDAAKQRDRDASQKPTTPAGASQAPTAGSQVNTLPVEEARANVVKLIRGHQVSIIVGETGSGKTTLIPQFYLDDILYPAVKTGVKGGVCCTQPRRVAAITIAEYVAKTRKCELGGEIGYAVRFDEKVSAATKLKFVTDGILLRELLADPLLRKYSCILLDEAHERTLHGDVLFGLLKQLIRRRKDLHIVVMSATLNAQQFSEFWNGAPIGFIPGRSYPVSVFHTDEPQLDYVDAAITTALQVHLEEEFPGDILCFLTGQDEIEDVKRVLEERRALLPQSAKGFEVCTLYAAMTPQAQLQAFRPAAPNSRKIILATNIAETSITIEGIKYVIDTGVVKARNYDPATTLDSLQVREESKAQARQRQGRAGRMSAGKCFRLFTESSFEEMPENTIPEILRCNLSSVVLQMMCMGIDDILGFEFMDPPSKTAILRAMQQLTLLGAIDATPTGSVVTALGGNMVKFPVDPMAAKAIAKGVELGVGVELCAIVAMLAADAALFNSQQGSAGDMDRSRFAKTAGDHITLLHIFETYRKVKRKERTSWCDAAGVNAKQMARVLDVFHQLLDIVTELPQGANIAGPSPTAIAAADEGDELNPPSKAHRAEHSFVMNKADADRDNELVRLAVTHGYFMNGAYYSHPANGYLMLIDHTPVALHPSSVLFKMKKKPPCVVFNSVIQTTKNYMRDVVAIREEWLHLACSTLYPQKSHGVS